MITLQAKSICDVYLDPISIFKSNGQLKSSGWTAFILLIALTLISYILFFQNMSPDWIIQQQLLQMGDLSEHEKIEMAKYMESSVEYTGVIGGVISSLIFIATSTVLACYFYLVANKNKSQSFRSCFSFSLWLQMPQAINLLGFMVIFVTNTTVDLPINLMNYASVNQLFFNLPFNNSFFSLLETINVFTIWTVVLTTIGLSKWGGYPLTKACMFAVLPYLVIFGGWSLSI